MPNELDNQELDLLLDTLLAKSDLNEVNADSNGSGFETLPDGYYLSSLEKSELTTSKSSGKPMFKLTFGIVENGISVDIDDNGNPHLNEIDKTKGRKIFLNYVMSDEKSVRRFVSDMMKFEGEDGKSLVDGSYFTSTKSIIETLDALTGSNFYIQIQTTVKDGKSSTWNNPISFKRAAKLNLPIE